MDHPAVNVCMPVFNGRNFLPRIFECFAAQTFKDFEIIAIDDGSTDGSGNIARQLLADKSLRGVVIRTPNRGAEQARDVACSNCTADIIAQADCDDYWEPTYLEEMVRALSENPELDIVYADMIDHYPDERTVLKSNVAKWVDLSQAKAMGDLYLFKKGQFLQYQLSGQVLFPQATVYRRSFYEHVGLYDDVKSGLQVSLDWHFGIRASRIAAVGFLKRPLVHRYIHDNNVTNDVIRMWTCSTQVIKVWLADKSLTPKERANARGRGALIAAWAAYESWATRKKQLQSALWALRSLRFRWRWQTVALLMMVAIPRGLIDMLHGGG